MTPNYSMSSEFGNDAVHAIVRQARILHMNWPEVHRELVSLAQRFPNDFGEADSDFVRKAVYIDLGFSSNFYAAPTTPFYCQEPVD